MTPLDQSRIAAANEKRNRKAMLRLLTDIATRPEPVAKSAKRKPDAADIIMFQH